MFKGQKFYRGFKYTQNTFKDRFLIKSIFLWLNSNFKLMTFR